MKTYYTPYYCQRCGMIWIRKKGVTVKRCPRKNCDSANINSGAKERVKLDYAK